MQSDVTSVVQTERVFKKWDYAVFTLLTLVCLSATTWFVTYWLSFRSWVDHPVRFIISVFIFIVIVGNYFGRWFLLPYMRRPKPIAAKPGWRVAVVTTVIPRNEPVEMLEQTLSALVGLDYPHDTWVLDEDDSDEVKALCKRLGANHFTRKHKPEYQTDSGKFQSRSKHGNYNSWLYEVGFDRYEIITAFDPDHVPNSDFLLKTLGYFDDPRVGYVQAAQVYYNQKASFIARGAAEETYAYYSSVQMASFGLGYPVIIGCHNTHRSSALKQVGGFAPHDADDLLVTLFYRSGGWQGVYVPQILARGLTPVDWSGYLTQQRRWARSVLDIKLRIYHTVSDNLSLRTRIISFLHGFNYLYKSFMIFVGLLLSIFMLITGSLPKVISLEAVPVLGAFCLVLLACDLYRQRFYLDPRTERGLHWRVAILHFAKWPYILMALCDVLLGRRVPYVLTSKAKATSRRRMMVWPHLIIALLISLSWLTGVNLGNTVEPSLHLWAGLIVTGSLALALTEFMRFPDPYDKKLAPLAKTDGATKEMEWQLR
jgi:cellulose synthase/poly-beta-1,6-N-acetylglucosamine synthase-like glycosyltransferase